MKVYIVVERIDYEGDTVLKVFSTREAAKVYATEEQYREPDFADYVIIEQEVE